MSIRMFSGLKFCHKEIGEEESRELVYFWKVRRGKEY
jgi:hypothetical protein